jgi:protein associated with RNAse G/E
MEYALEKWGRRPHYRGDVRRLGEDEHGTWLWGPKGRTIWRGETGLFVAEQDALFLVVPGAWWSPGWWLEHPEIEVYVNVQTPVEWEADRARAIDLDLDVIRFRDGRVEVVDRDEFDLHRQRDGYPEDIVASAEEAAAAVFDLVVANAPPFDGTAAGEWARAART